MYCLGLWRGVALGAGVPDGIKWPHRDRYSWCGSKVSASGVKDEDKDNDFEVLSAVRSKYNDIVIVDTSKSRLLLLDDTHNVHSIFNKERKWTDSYWDEFANLPGIIPQGPIAIYGLGGGTAAHLMLDVWPSLQLHGWEIDQILIDKAREYLGLSLLEKPNQQGGILHVCLGDVFDASAAATSIPGGGYAGIVIDLFSEGQVLPQLEEASTWLELNDRLMPNGRLMVNCGATDTKISSTNPTLNALWTAFPGQLSWKKMGESSGENYLALTGPLPDFNIWSATVPDHLRISVQQWRPFEPVPQI